MCVCVCVGICVYVYVCGSLVQIKGSEAAGAGGGGGGTKAPEWAWLQPAAHLRPPGTMTESEAIIGVDHDDHGDRSRPSTPRG